MKATIEINMKNLRDDLRLQDFAKAKGWKIERNVRDEGLEIPFFSLTFKKGNKSVWFCRLGWACAELSKGGSYENHRYNEDLEAVLNKES